MTKNRRHVLLASYLQKIRLGQPVNFPAFLKVLPEASVRRHREVFATTKVGADLWEVEILDEEAVAALEAAAVAPDSRAGAAGQGDSHKHGTSHGFMLVYHEQLTSPRPEVVVVPESGGQAGFTPKPSVLVIENEENFFHHRAMLQFAGAAMGKPLDLSNCDVVLGGGNRTTRQSCLDWLSRYPSVYCAFDYDAGGLRMFATISRALGEKAQFVQPADWSDWLSSFRRHPGTTERFTRAIHLAEDLGFDSLAGAFRETGRFMEQEMILDE